MAKKLRSLLGEIDKKFKESEEVRKQSHTLTMTSLAEQHAGRRSNSTLRFKWTSIYPSKDLYK